MITYWSGVLMIVDCILTQDTLMWHSLLTIISISHQNVFVSFYFQRQHHYHSPVCKSFPKGLVFTGLCSTDKKLLLWNATESNKCNKTLRVFTEEKTYKNLEGSGTNRHASCISYFFCLRLTSKINIKCNCGLQYWCILQIYLYVFIKCCKIYERQNSS